MLLLFLSGGGTLRGEDWNLSIDRAGPFPALRPVTLTFQCGWAGLTAGELKLGFAKLGEDECELDGTAATTGLARALWRLDATHQARGNLATLRPETVTQKEVYRAQTVQMDLEFDRTGVWRKRESTNDRSRAKRKHFDYPELHDFQTAFLFIRSQALEQGATYNVLVYPGNNAYVATVTVLGREPVKVRTGTHPAIRLDLRLRKVNAQMELEPHGKFKHATCWLSDDENRLPLRVNAQIFIGSVWVELEKVAWAGMMPALSMGADAPQ